MNAQTNADIASLRVNPADELWLGAVRAPSGTNWYWEGALLMFYNSTTPGGVVTSGLYANWGVNQPSGGVEELCTRMLEDALTWGDQGCTTVTEYAVCQGPAL